MSREQHIQYMLKVFHDMRTELEKKMSVYLENRMTETESEFYLQQIKSINSKIARYNKELQAERSKNG